MPPNEPGCLSTVPAKLPTRCPSKRKALAHFLKVAVRSNGQVWTSDPHGPVGWAKLSNTVPLNLGTLHCEMAVRPHRAYTLSWGIILSQGVCEVKGRHICPAQLRRLRMFSSAVTSQGALAFLPRSCLPVTLLFKSEVLHPLLSPPLHSENPFKDF